MARPRSDQRESAIIDAAINIFAAEGLNAPTAAIARAAGVSNGSLFLYFPKKSDLINRVYIDLKSEMAAATAGMPAGDDRRTQLHYVWHRWLEFASTYPAKRKVLAMLSVSDEINPTSKEVGYRSMAQIADLVHRCRRGGALDAAPIEFVVAIIMGMAEATMNFKAGKSKAAGVYDDAAFDALWRAIT